MTIIESSQADMRRETRELFKQMKPYLDQGKSFTYALHQCRRGTNTKSRWYKDIREYVIRKGYPIKPNYRNPDYEN